MRLSLKKIFHQRGENSNVRNRVWESPTLRLLITGWVRRYQDWKPEDVENVERPCPLLEEKCAKVLLKYYYSK